MEKAEKDQAMMSKRMQELSIGNVNGEEPFMLLTPEGTPGEVEADEDMQKVLCEAQDVIRKQSPYCTIAANPEAFDIS